MSIFEAFHEPETACDPAGPFATRVASPLPVTGSALVALLSLNSKVAVLPSDEIVVFDVTKDQAKGYLSTPKSATAAAP